MGTRWPSVPARLPPCEEQRKSPLRVLVWASRSAVPGSNCSDPAVVRIRGGFIWSSGENSPFPVCNSGSESRPLFLASCSPQERSFNISHTGKMCFKTSTRPVAPHPKKAFLAYMHSPDCDNHAAVVERNLFLTGISPNPPETLQLPPIHFHPCNLYFCW